MAKHAVLVAGLLLIAESQASDVAQADPSAVQGFLSQYMTAPTQRMIIDDKPALHPAPQMQDSYAFTSAKDMMDAHFSEHAMLEMAISSVAIVHQVHCMARCPKMCCRAKGLHSRSPHRSPHRSLGIPRNFRDFSGIFGIVGQILGFLVKIT